MLRYPVVLLPALGTDFRLWQPVVDRLDDIAESSVVTYRGDSIEAMADNVLADAPDRFYLAGMSMGGYVALEVALRRTGRAVGLALLNTSGRAAPEDRRASGLRMIELAESGQYDLAVGHVAGAVAPRDRPDVAALAVSMANDLGAEAFRDQQRAVLDRRDRCGELVRIDTPALVVGGATDTIIPIEHSVELAAAIPDAELVAVDGCGHFSSLEDPARIADVLRAWLLRVDGEALEQTGRAVAPGV